MLYGGFAHVHYSSIFYTMASMVSKTQKTKTIVWTDEEVGLLLNVFAEETIQIGLEKAKCPKDKNAVYLEVKKKLEQHGKFHAKILASDSFYDFYQVTVFHFALMLFRFQVVSKRNDENCRGNYGQIEKTMCKIQRSLKDIKDSAKKSGKVHGKNGHNF